MTNKLYLHAVLALLFNALILSACDDAESDRTADPTDTDTTDPNTKQQNLSCAPSDTFVNTHGQLQVDGASLKNSCGEHVRLKGISSMWLNWENNGFAESKQAMEWMIENWNITLIRAAMGIEPAGAYLSNPEKAKGQVNTIVQNAIDAGIYVIIDWHDHNAHQHQDEAIAFFKEMATKWGSYPNVIYEIWNEPLNVDWATVIKPYHEAVVAAIRAIDPDNIIVMGTPQWCQRVDVAINDPVEGTNLMYTLHFYSCSHGRDLMGIAWDAYFAGVPLFVTEWGATHADGGLIQDGHDQVCADEADAWFEDLDAMNASWAAWKLDGCSDISCLLTTSAPTDGGWDNHLHGHAEYVIGKLLEED